MGQSWSNAADKNRLAGSRVSIGLDLPNLCVDRRAVWAAYGVPPCWRDSIIAVREMLMETMKRTA